MYLLIIFFLNTNFKYLYTQTIKDKKNSEHKVS